jgi:hypothetical protein
MTEEGSDAEIEVRAEITPDFVLAVYNEAQKSTGDQRKLMIKVAEVLAEHVGEFLESTD